HRPPKAKCDHLESAGSTSYGECTVRAASKIESEPLIVVPQQCDSSCGGSMSSSPKATVGPPFDPELGAVLTGLGMPATMTAEMLPQLREVPATQLDDLIAGRAITHTERTIP